MDTKWSEVKILTHTDASSLIEMLRTLFAAYGPPEEVSDNGPPFASEQLANFFKRNAVIHTFTPTYHTQSNGSAETTVRSVKEGLLQQLLVPSSVSFLCNITLTRVFFTIKTRLTPPLECPRRNVS